MRIKETGFNHEDAVYKIAASSEQGVVDDLTQRSIKTEPQTQESTVEPTPTDSFVDALGNDLTVPLREREREVLERESTDFATTILAISTELVTHPRMRRRTAIIGALAFIATGMAIAAAQGNNTEQEAASNTTRDPNGNPSPNLGEKLRRDKELRPSIYVRP